MKQKPSLLLATILCLSLLLTACGGHEHTFSTDWSKDATHHWHACTGEGCSDVADKAEHSYGADGTCTCGAENPVVTTIDSDEAWAAALDIGTNWTIYNPTPGGIVEARDYIARRNGNKLVESTVYADSDPAYYYSSVENGVGYQYVPFWDNDNGIFLGYQKIPSDLPVEEFLSYWDDTLPGCFSNRAAFTYNAETKHYEAASLIHDLYTDAWIAFENGKLAAWGYTVHRLINPDIPGLAGPDSLTNQYTITYNNVPEITLPTNLVEHTFSTDWSKDATHHWHACTGEGCTDVADKAEHSYGADGTCTCGAVKPVVTTVDSDEAWAAAFNPGTNWTIHAVASANGTTAMDALAERNGNNLKKTETEGSNASITYNTVEGNACYVYQEVREGNEIVGFKKIDRTNEYTSADQFISTWADTYLSAGLFDDRTEFTYNAETKRYEAASLADGAATNAWITFVDGKVTGVGYDATMGSSTMTVVITVTHGNTAAVTLPTNLVVITTINSGGEWSTALNIGTNWTITSPAPEGVVGAEDYIARRNGNKLVEYSTTDDPQTYQYKSVENGVCYAYYPSWDGGGNFTGHRREDMESTADVYTAGWADMLPANTFVYDLFTYNAETKHYEAESLAGGMMTDIWLSFENGKLVAWGYTMNMDMGTGPMSITGEFSITYYDAGEITLPTNYYDAE